jgi:copper oxidase (laccase) domain-containing protein
MLAVPQQTHSTLLTCIDTPGSFMTTDGLMTDNPEIILTL